MPRLVGQSTEISGQAFDLSGAKVTIGRTPDNTIHIPDNSISSHHAELSFDGSDYAVHDLNSTNGTRVNGEKVATATLRRGDVLHIGNVELLYESENSPVSLALPQLHVGIPLEQAAFRGRPAHFVSSGPSLRAPQKEKTPWALVVGLAGALAVGGIGYFVYTLITTPVAG